VTIRLGYQIPNFTYPGVPVENLFDTVAAQAREAEAAGFDTVLVMDHFDFYQLPGIGTPDNAMLESYTTLGALASATSTIQLSTLVTGVTYRNPAHLAKAVTTLDVVSKGRAILGIGAGWFEREHHDYGFEFGTFGQRFERLERAAVVLVGLAWTQLGHGRVERATVLLGAAAATRDAVGLTSVGAERIETEMALDAARAQLPAETFPAALAPGRELTTEQALGAALDPG
jgi:hypothetical protein